MIYQAIVTKFHGATNTKGARITAKSYSGSITVPYDHSMGTMRNHESAAAALAAKYGLHGSWFAGIMPGNEHGYVFVEAGGERPSFVSVSIDS